MNLMAVAHCKAFGYFYQGAVSSVLEIKKQRDEGKPQFSHAFKLLAVGESALLSRIPADDKVCQGAATNKH
jgi:hypothetical protein